MAAYRGAMLVSPRRVAPLSFGLAVLLLMGTAATPVDTWGAETDQADAPDAVGQLGDPRGPGQAVARPSSQCPETVACRYSERTFLPSGYRFQSLEVCGANCTTQYWVTLSTGDRTLLAIPPVRGGGLVLVSRATLPDQLQSVRTVLPDYAPKDPACCPSGFRDTVYGWDPGEGALVAQAENVIPAPLFGGWDAERAALQAEGFFEVFTGL